MSGMLMERLHLVKGLDPVADGLSGTVYSDVVDMADFERILFVVYGGVASGGTGASTLTVQACDDIVPSNRTAIPFKSREIATTDAEGAITDRAAAGYVATAGSSKITLVEVHQSALAETGYHYVQLKTVESVNDPVVTAILVIGEKKQAASSAAPSAID
jgi:hypothetical protein